MQEIGTRNGGSMTQDTHKPVKGYIFDYGGTLDTHGNHWGIVIWQAYEAEHVPVSHTDYCEAYVYAERALARERIILPHFTFRDTLDAKLHLQMMFLRTHKAWAVSEQEQTTLRKKVLSRLYAEVQVITAESKEVLQTLHECVPLVLVSNFYGNIHTVLKEMQMDGLFSSVVESSVVGVRKPDPQIFRLGVEACRRPAKDIMVVGDSFTKDILPARQAGCLTAWYKGEDWEKKEYDETIPDRIINNLHDLL